MSTSPQEVVDYLPMSQMMEDEFPPSVEQPRRDGRRMGSGLPADVVILCLCHETRLSPQSVTYCQFIIKDHE
ncbi:hypothetical protein BgiMline_010359 [Biomphalaria glabrata]|uniref:Uncharacterized protein n=1 Tax=Biomphalaria pfeifferi TaxID=112525 RepID=A0AAD8C041_BIOPF|nr:hypothetical protein BgiMline_024091 [Biomphalaria glabrata]KAI8771800.1 hypothetical protein BgiBS90_027335 [Biomphalaria glabrata]KAK0064049.1 hypothetical protein Bpfe_006734 [Biomphalaria pfeifferi]